MEKRRFKYWLYLFSVSLTVIAIIISAVLVHHNSTNLTTLPAGNSIQDQSETMNSAFVFSSALELKFKNSRPTSLPSADQLNSLPDSLLASDNMTMVLLKGAQISMPFDNPMTGGKKHIEKIVSVKTLYMDKTKVTNYLYAEFLNGVEGIEVKNKSVFLTGKLLLLLGEVREGYEPITFEDKKFRIKPEAAEKPVVRVTPVGAVAYAQFYGKSLPLMKQWWLAVQTGQGQTDVKKTSSSSKSHMTEGNGNWMMNDQGSRSEPSSDSKRIDIESVTQGTSNTVGIQGLEQNVNEWTMSFSPEGTLQFHIHGGVGELTHRESYLERQPWEAFARVGFRTVLGLKKEK